MSDAELSQRIALSSCVPRERFDRRARGLQGTFSIWRRSPEQMRPRVLVSENKKVLASRGHAIHE